MLTNYLPFLRVAHPIAMDLKLVWVAEKLEIRKRQRKWGN